jgi:hypothetical protein
MHSGDSPLDPAALKRARSLLARPARSQGVGSALAAAAALAVTALVFATAMVVAPPLTARHAVESAPD